MLLVAVAVAVVVAVAALFCAARFYHSQRSIRHRPNQQVQLPRVLVRGTVRVFGARIVDAGSATPR